jgi:hypothetical protein
MKQCSYCGAEYPDDAIVCAIDQTPFDKICLAENPPVAPAIKRKIPIPLSIVSYCFFASGISYLGWFAIGAYLGRFFLPNLIVGILNLFVSRGLRRCSRHWRICALVLMCLVFLENCFKITQNFRYSGHMPDMVFCIGWFFSFAVLIWFYQVLTRPDIRELFYNEL